MNSGQSLPSPSRNRKISDSDPMPHEFKRGQRSRNHVAVRHDFCAELRQPRVSAFDSDAAVIHDGTISLGMLVSKHSWDDRQRRFFSSISAHGMDYGTPGHRQNDVCGREIKNEARKYRLSARVIGLQQFFGSSFERCKGDELQETEEHALRGKGRLSANGAALAQIATPKPTIAQQHCRADNSEQKLRFAQSQDGAQLQTSSMSRRRHEI